MQLKLNVTEATNKKFREFCESHQMNLSQGLSNLLLRVEMLEDLVSTQKQNNQSQQELIQILKSRLGE